MVLTDREIISALRYGHIIIDPEPQLDSFSSTAVDLTLLNKFTTWDASPGVPLRPGAKGHKFSHLDKFQKPHTTDTFELKPQSFVLAWTKEVIQIPMSSRLAARVEGKSSVSRLGVGVHVTAPTIHCGFEGPIQLEMFNLGPHTVLLDAGMAICQLIFEQTLGVPEKGYDGNFLNQKPMA